MDTNEIADQDDLPLWNFTREMWVGRLDTINCWIGRMVAQKRRKRYRLILRWLLENGATQLRGIELLPDAIAEAIRDQEKWGCSARTVQRAIAFFETAGILARWARCDGLGCPLPPGGRLLWGSVLQSLGREPDGTIRPAVSLDGHRDDQGSAVSAAVSFSPVHRQEAVTETDLPPGGGDSKSSCHQGVVTGTRSAEFLSPPPRQSAGGGDRNSHGALPEAQTQQPVEHLHGCFREPARIVACVRAYTLVSEDLTAVVDDDGKARRISWREVHAAAAATERLVTQRISYPSRMEPPRMHQVAWVALAVFSADWLEESAEAANNILRTGFKPLNITNYFLGCARGMLRRCENIPEFASREKLHDFLEDLCSPIKRWVKQQLLAAKEESAPEPAAPARPRTVGDTRPQEVRERERIELLRALRKQGLPLSAEQNKELAALDQPQP